MTEKLLPCPFCGGEARTFDLNGTAQATCARDAYACAGPDVVAPVAMWNCRTPAPEGEVVAWRVKDYADGWILFYHEAPARASGEARNGALVQPLYASPVVPVGREEIARMIYATLHHKMAVNGTEAQSLYESAARSILAALGTKATDTGREG
jgi:hypothetical protein